MTTADMFVLTHGTVAGDCTTNGLSELLGSGNTLRRTGMDNLKIRAISAPWHSGVEILVTDGHSRVKDIIFEKMEDGLMVDPTFRVDNKTAQTLIDDLWAAGLRPTDGTGSAGQLKATEKHLSDMRDIAFNQLGLPGK